ncbi:hypothetical protein ABW19_dt0203459 [Dactylella cylindrospora]|nr:hypothetical protein ABW19_dt0203459 [Dactylella cylindrospora]
MSAPTTETPAEKLDIPGSCHCGGVKYIAKNVDLSKAAKCNCTICVATGRLGVSLDPGNILITNAPSSTPQQITYTNSLDTTLFPPSLTYYSPAFNRGECEIGKEPARYFFCKTCGIHLFVVAFIPQVGGDILGVNIISLDLKSVGRDLKDVSDPKGLKYARGLDDTWQMSEGKPWPHGPW